MTEHDLAPGGTVAYVMTGPDGDRHRGWWRVRAVDPPHTLEFEAGFADADGNPSPDPPTSVIRVVLSELAGGGTQMVITTTWASVEAMEQMLATGMDAGMTAAVGQIDELLGLPAEPAPPTPINRTRGDRHDRDLHLRRLCHPRRLRLLRRGGDWGGYWGKQGPEFLDHRLAVSARTADGPRGQHLPAVRGVAGPEHRGVRGSTR